MISRQVQESFKIYLKEIKMFNVFRERLHNNDSSFTNLFNSNHKEEDLVAMGFVWERFINWSLVNKLWRERLKELESIPKIGELCKVWNTEEEPSNESSRCAYGILQDFHFEGNTCTYIIHSSPLCYQNAKRVPCDEV